MPAFKELFGHNVVTNASRSLLRLSNPPSFAYKILQHFLRQLLARNLRVVNGSGADPTLFNRRTRIWRIKKQSKRAQARSICEGRDLRESKFRL
jgi:hypothetical protein